MAKNSAIEWTGHTWNPWVGCQMVSPGCKNCYMFREMRRYGQDPHNIRRTKPATSGAPLGWNDPAMVFTCSWSDFFLEEADPWRSDAWEIIRRTPHLTYQILTKRPENLLTRLPEYWDEIRHHVWLGVTVETQAQYDRIRALLTIPKLIIKPSACFFISYEPAIGPLRLENRHLTGQYIGSRVGWVIAGGETGEGARPTELEWMRSVRDQCKAHGIPFFLKQITHNGQKIPFDQWDGQDQVREFPQQRQREDDEHTTTPAPHGQPDGQGEGTRDAGHG